jgi:transposase
MVRRYELTDPRFALTEDLLPRNGRRGAQRDDHRTTLNGVFWLPHTGAQWREVPERYGKWASTTGSGAGGRAARSTASWNDCAWGSIRGAASTTTCGASTRPRSGPAARRRGIEAVIPTHKDRRRNPQSEKETYRRRNVVERCANWLKENRRLGTRHGKPAVHFPAMAEWAMIRRCLRPLDSSDRP